MSRTFRPAYFSALPTEKPSGPNNPSKPETETMVCDADGTWLTKTEARQKWANDLVRGFVSNPLRGTVMLLIGIGGVVAFDDHIQRSQRAAQRSERNTRRAEQKRLKRLLDKLQKLSKG